MTDNFTYISIIIFISDHQYNFRIGNISLSLTKGGKEIFVITITQFISSVQPNFLMKTYKASLKIEALIIEGASVEDHLIPILSSEHTYNNPPYFFKMEIEKLPPSANATHNLNVNLEALELLYHQVSVITLL